MGEGGPQTSVGTWGWATERGTGDLDWTGGGGGTYTGLHGDRWALTLTLSPRSPECAMLLARWLSLSSSTGVTLAHPHISAQWPLHREAF